MESTARSPPSRDETENRRRQHRQEDGESQDRRVEANLIESGKVAAAGPRHLGSDDPQDVQAPERQDQPQTASEQTEKKALREHLPDDAASSRSQRTAYRDLLRASSCTG
jgi:hypothetical protein